MAQQNLAQLTGARELHYPPPSSQSLCFRHVGPLLCHRCSLLSSLSLPFPSPPTHFRSVSSGPACHKPIHFSGLGIKPLPHRESFPNSPQPNSSPLSSVAPYLPSCTDHLSFVLLGIRIVSMDILMFNFFFIPLSL